MKKNLIITGGIFHPFSETSDTLSKILNSLGYDSEITLDVEEGIKNINDFDILLIMTNKNSERLWSPIIEHVKNK